MCRLCGRIDALLSLLDRPPPRQLADGYRRHGWREILLAVAALFAGSWAAAHIGCAQTWAWNACSSAQAVSQG
jgi:hypothetical protein